MALHHGAARASSRCASCPQVVSAVKQTHAAPILPASATCAASASGRVERCTARSLVAHCSRRSGVTRSAVATEQPIQLDTAPAPPQPAPVPATQHGHKEVEFVAFEDGVFTVEGRLTLAAPVGLVYGILADYDACADVFHNITSSSSQQLGPGQLQVTQTCRWSFLAFSGDFDCTFLVQQQSQTRELEFKLQESSFMRDFQGQWRVLPATLERGPVGGGCVVEHRLSVRPLMDVPAPIAKLTSGIFMRQVSCILDDLQRELDRQLAASKQ